MKKSIFLICIILLTSCSSLYRFTIEVQEPAPLTLPPDILQVLIVNNSTPQPSETAINRIFRGKEIDGMTLNLDSVAGVVTVSLASELRESRFFDRVMVSPASLRNDNNWMSNEALTETFKTEAFETHGFDGIISIDRVLIRLNQEVRNDFYTHLRISGTTACSIYLHDRKSPLTAFSISDSLSISLPTMGDTADIFKYLPEALIHDLAGSSGRKLSQYIIPSWNETERCLYSAPKARLYEALRFAQKGNWIKAYSLWQNEYSHISQPETKARIAANLAVACEMQDQFAAALEWATAAQNHFEKAGKPDASPEIIRIQAYINQLQKRMRDNDLLDMQWGSPDD
jgi:hypothetical protein